ncbi:MAG: hypothetical protein KAR06_05160, partial [Deltaproteobacteria bacterium]|nr:hypothetical protein [Deltaproteobacteria bacterium]
MPVTKAKKKSGKDLINLFSKPLKKKGKLIRRMPDDYPEEWDEFIDYGKYDVISEREVRRYTRPLSKSERILWELDRTANLRGVNFDVQAVHDAIYIREKEKSRILQRVDLITDGGLANINSNAQFKGYMGDIGLDLENVQKEYLKETLKSHNWDEVEELGLTDSKQAKELISLRVLIARVSLKKLDKLLLIWDKGRAYGLLRFLGAMTGRWSGNLFQPQNLPREGFEFFQDMDQCIELLKYHDPELIELVYGDVMDALVKCIRGMIIASPGCRLVASDLSQIESRMLAWLAGDQAKLDAYEG